MINKDKRFTVIATETLVGSGAIVYHKDRQWFATFEEAETEAQEIIARNRNRVFSLVIVCAQGIVSPVQSVPTVTTRFEQAKRKGKK